MSDSENLRIENSVEGMGIKLLLNYNALVYPDPVININ